MPGGRPRKPTQLRVLEGNAGKRPLPENEPTPPAGIPSCPSWLSGKAKAAWREVAPLLEGMRVLTVADRKALELLCDAYSEYRDAREVVQRLGFTYESRIMRADSKKVTPEGRADDFDPEALSVMIRARPEVGIAADAWRRVQRMLSEFGLTPASRSKAQATGKPEDADPLEGLRRGNRRTG